MSDCSACGGTGFTLSMEPCTHGAAPHTFAAPDWLPPLTSAHPPPSVYDYDEPPIVVPTPTIHKAAPKAATPKQEEFIRRLIAERDPSLPAAVAATMLLKDGVMTAKAASNIIDALMETATPPRRHHAPTPTTAPAPPAVPTSPPRLDGSSRSTAYGAPSISTVNAQPGMTLPRCSPTG